MEKDHEIVRLVYEAKENNEAADDLIRRYIPFIRAEASKFMSRFCTDSDDEYSIAMIAFHEAILGYSRDRGAFLKYAGLLIRSRLTDLAMMGNQAILHADLRIKAKGNSLLFKVK